MDFNILKSVRRYSGYALICIFLFASVSSCKEKNTISHPDYLLPNDTLVAILSDIHMADAYMSVRRTEKLEYDKKDLYASILKGYSVSLERFDTTIQFYTHHAELYELIYEKVLSRISTLEADYASLDKESRDAKLDSLTLRHTYNETAIDTAIKESQEFIEKAAARRMVKDEKKLKAKKAPRL